MANLGRYTRNEKFDEKYGNNPVYSNGGKRTIKYDPTTNYKSVDILNSALRDINDVNDAVNGKDWTTKESKIRYKSKLDNAKTTLSKYKKSWEGTEFGDAAEKAESVASYLDERVNSLVDTTESDAIITANKGYQAPTKDENGIYSMNSYTSALAKLDNAKTQEQNVFDRIKSGDSTALSGMQQLIDKAQKLTSERADRVAAYNSMKSVWDKEGQAELDKQVETQNYQNYLNNMSDSRLEGTAKRLERQYDSLRTKDFAAGGSASEINELTSEYDAQLKDVSSKMNMARSTLDTRKKEQYLAEINQYAKSWDYDIVINKYTEGKSNAELGEELQKAGGGNTWDLTKMAWNGITLDFSDVFGGTAWTSDQKEMYFYLKAKFGEEKAQEYADTIKDTVDERIADAIAEDTKEGFAKYPIALFLGCSSAFEGAEQFLVDEPIYTTQDYLNEIYQEEAEKDGELGKIAYSSLYSAGNMAPALALTIPTGGVGGAAIMGGSFFLTSGGQAKGDALKEGKKLSDAWTYGIIEGLSEALMETAIGGVGSIALKGANLSGKLTKRIASAVRGSANTPAMKGLMLNAYDVFGSSASEFIEEYTQQICEPLYRNIAFAEDNDFEPFTTEALEAGISGMLIGGVLGGGRLALAYGSANKQAGKAKTTFNGKEQTIEEASVDALVDMGKMFPETSESYKAAKIMEEGGLKNKLIENLNKAYLISQMQTETGGKTSEEIKPYIESVNKWVSVFNGLTLDKGAELFEEEINKDNGETEKKALAFAFYTTFTTNMADYVARITNKNQYDSTNGNYKQNGTLTFALSGQQARVIVDGEYASLDQIDFENDEQQMLYEVASKIEDVQQANAFVNFYESSGISDIAKYSSVFEVVYNMATEGNEVSYIQDAVKNLGSKATKKFINSVYKEVTKNFFTKSDENAVYALADLLGYDRKNIEFVYGLNDKEGNVVNGEIDTKTGKIKINRASKSPALVVFAHELTHSLEESNKELYEEYSDKIMEFLNKDENKNRKEAIFKIEPDKTEIVAMASEMLMVDKGFIDFLSEDKKFFNAFQSYFYSMTARVAGGYKSVDKMRETLWSALNLDDNDRDEFEYCFKKLFSLYDEEEIKEKEEKDKKEKAEEEFKETVESNEELLKESGKPTEKLSRIYEPEHIKALEDFLSKEENAKNSALSLSEIKKRYAAIVKIWDDIGGELNSEFLKEWDNSVGKDRKFSIFKDQMGYKYNEEFSSMCKKGVPLFEAIDTIVREEVMERLNSKYLGKEEKEILYGILKSHNFEIPCGICFVEQARQHEGEIIDKFLNGKYKKKKNGEWSDYKIGWNELLDKIEVRMAEKGVEYKFENVSRDIANSIYEKKSINMDERTQDAFYESLMELANEEIERLNKGYEKLESTEPEEVEKKLGGNKGLNIRMFKTLFMEKDSRLKFDADLLYSSITTQHIASEHQMFYTLFNMQGGTAGYKTKQRPVIYWGDILRSEYDSDKVRLEGSIRTQSNSDFQMYTFLDMCQKIIDYTAKGYYMQAYTKSIAEAKLFGLSKCKINLSLIPRIVEYKDDGVVDVKKTMQNAGLDENGELLFDGIEGINPDEAFMLLADPEYSKNLAGICIGFSDKHILKMLDDARIQEIIGYHDKTNKIKKRFAKAAYANNYAGVNEAKKLYGDKKTVHINFTKFILRAEKEYKTMKYDGRQATWDDVPRLAAQLYLEYCKEHNYSPAYSKCMNGAFVKHKNYYKLLADYGLYDCNGHYAPSQKVEFNIPDQVPVVLENGVKSMAKTSTFIRDELKAELNTLDRLKVELADKSENGIIPQFINEVNKETKNSKNYDSEGNELSEAQAEFFKDSKVRDENGNLLVMYHGTGADFTIFDENKIGRTGALEGTGFNFTSSEARATGYSYAVSEYVDYDYEDDLNPHLLKGYVNIERPLSNDKITLTVNELAELILKVDPTGDSIISDYAKDTRDYGQPTFAKREAMTVAKNMHLFCDNDADIYSSLSGGSGGYLALMNAFKELGYDGLVHYDFLSGRINTAIAFNPNQFKNADNLNPTENPDMRYSKNYSTEEYDIQDSLDISGGEFLTGYENVPDNLMGFSTKDGATQKEYNESNYPYNLKIWVSVDGGYTFAKDEIKGLNRLHAIERARRNWNNYDVVIKDRNTNAQGTKYSQNYDLETLEKYGITGEMAKRLIDIVKYDRILPEKKHYMFLDESRIDEAKNMYGSKMAYAVWMKPYSFINATTIIGGADRIRSESTDLDLDHLRDVTQTPYLIVRAVGDKISLNNFEIIGHEGRHRMAALDDAGYDNVAMILYVEGADGKAMRMEGLDGQEFGESFLDKGDEIYIHNAIPINDDTIEFVKDVFSKRHIKSENYYSKNYNPVSEENIKSTLKNSPLLNYVVDAYRRNTGSNDHTDAFYDKFIAEVLDSDVTENDIWNWSGVSSFEAQAMGKLIDDYRNGFKPVDDELYKRAIEWGAISQYDVRSRFDFNPEYIPVKLYHGTPHKPFREFMGGATYLTDNWSMASSYGENVYDLYLQNGNYLVFDAVGMNWDSVWDGDDLVSTRRIEEQARRGGYDGAIIRNVYDYARYTDEEDVSGDVYIVFDPSKIKSAKEITYDTENNEIPLDQRFSDSRDINYSKNYDNLLSKSSEKAEEAFKSLNEAIDNVGRLNDTTYKAIYKQVTRGYNVDETLYSKEKGSALVKAVVKAMSDNPNVSYDTFRHIASDYLKPMVRAMYEWTSDDNKTAEFRHARYYIPENQREELYQAMGVENGGQVSSQFLPYQITWTNDSNGAMTVSEDWDRIVTFLPEANNGNPQTDVEKTMAFLKALKNEKMTRREYYRGDDLEYTADTLTLSLLLAVARNVEAAGKPIKDADKMQIRSAQSDAKNKIKTARNVFESEIKELKMEYDKFVKEEKDKNHNYKMMLKAKYEERLRQAKKLDQVRKTVRSIINTTLKPTTRNHFAREVIQFLPKIIDLLDITSNRRVSGANNEFYELANKVRAMAQQEVFDVDTQYEPEISKEIKKIADLVNGRKINELDSQELDDLNSILMGLKNFMKSIDSFIGMDINFEETEREIIEAAKANMHTGLGEKYLDLTLNPQRFLKRLTGYTSKAMDAVVDELSEGFVQQMQNEMEAWAIFQPISTNKKYWKEFNSMDDRLVEVTLGGKKVQITQGMKIALIMHCQNDDNLTHILANEINNQNLQQGKSRAFAEDGGIRIPNLKYFKKGDYASAAKYGEIVLPTAQELSELKPEGEFEKELIDCLTEYYEGFSKEKINEASLKLEGIARATVNNYYPITVDDDFLGTNIYTANDGVYSAEIISRTGMLKPRVKSGKPILLNSARQDLRRSISIVSRYNALSVPLRDFVKVYNGAVYDENGRDVTFKSVISQEAKKYIENFISDMNGTRNTQSGWNWFNKLKNNTAQAVLTFNPSVSIKQAASYPTAIAELSWTSVTKALAKVQRDTKKNGFFIARAEQELIAKYTPMLWERMQGLAIQETAEINTSYKTHIQKGMDKVPFLTHWIQKVDVATVGRLWYATKYWVEEEMAKGSLPKMEVGSEEYYKTVAKKFNDVVMKTQPNYSVITRPEIMRNPNALLRALMVFKTQPLQNFGILSDAIGEYNAVKKTGTKDEVKQSGRKLVRAITSQITQTLVFTSMTVLANLLLHKMYKYRDDDDEITLASFMQQFGFDFMDSFFGNAPVIEYFEDIAAYLTQRFVFEDEDAQYYPPSVFGLDTLTDLVDVLANITIKEDGDYEYQIRTILESVGNIFGIPVGNVRKVGHSIYEYISDIVNNTDPFSSQDSSTNMESKVEKIVETYENGGDVDELFEELLDKIDDTESDLYRKQSSLESALKEEYMSTTDKKLKSQIKKWMESYLGYSDEAVEDKVASWEESQVNDYKEGYLSGELTVNDIVSQTGLTKDAVKDKIKSWVSDYEDEYRRASSSRRKEIESDMKKTYGLTGLEVKKKTLTWLDTDTDTMHDELMNYWFKNASSEEIPYKSSDIISTWIVKHWDEYDREKLWTIAKDTLEYTDEKKEEYFAKWNVKSANYKAYGNATDEEILTSAWTSGTALNGLTKDTSNSVSAWCKETYRSLDASQREYFKSWVVANLGYNAKRIDSTANAWLED